MKYYKILDLEFKPVVEKILYYYFQNESMFKTFWTDIDNRDMIKYFPELQQMFDPLNITIKTIAFIKTTKAVTSIHHDYTPFCKTRINIPILNCDLTQTKFYITNTEPEKVLLPNGIPYFLYKEENCIHVDSVCLSAPTMLRIKEPHQVCSNNSKFPRISCTMDFNEDIEHLWD